MSKLRTFDEWSSAGFKIKKGSKARIDESDGKLKFDETQVERRFARTFEAYATQKRFKAPEPQARNPEPVYYADGSGYLPGSGPAGPLYFDKFGNT